MTLYTYIEMSMLRGKPPSSPVRVPGRYGVHSRDSTLLVFALSQRFRDRLGQALRGVDDPGAQPDDACQPTEEIRSCNVPSLNLLQTLA